MHVCELQGVEGARAMCEPRGGGGHVHCANY
jgi:hypothetical protein